MATPSSVGRRVNRRTAANAARTAAAAQPAVVPELVEDDDSFAPEDLAPVVTAGSDEAVSSPTAEQSKALARPSAQRNNQLRSPMDAVDLTRQIDQSDLVMPKLRISQGLSEVNKEFARTKGASGISMGNWYHSTSLANLGDTVYFIPVDMQKSRGLFIQGQGLMCRSFDMLQGQGDPGILCEGTFEERHELPEPDRGCVLRLWQRDEATKTNTPPKCGVAYNYPGLIVVDIDNPKSSKILTAVLTLRSTGVGVAKQINTIVMEQGDRVWHKVILELGLFEKQNPKGSFFVPTVDFFDRLDADEDYARVFRRAEGFAQSINPESMRATLEADAD